MTVAKIKEYIDNSLNKVMNTKRMQQKNKILISILKNVVSMLDELKLKAKWTNNMNGTFTCSKCGAKRPNDNYCGNCGARMENEE